MNAQNKSIVIISQIKRNVSEIAKEFIQKVLIINVLKHVQMIHRILHLKEYVNAQIIFIELEKIIINVQKQELAQVNILI